MIPQKPSDPCYQWKEYRLERIAAQMRAGHFETPQVNFSDSQKVEIALALQRQYAVTVWLDEDRLRYREGFQGPRIRLGWYDAAVLTGFLDRPERKRQIARKGVGRELLKRQRYIETA